MEFEFSASVGILHRYGDLPVIPALEGRYRDSSEQLGWLASLNQ